MIWNFARYCAAVLLLSPLMAAAQSPRIVASIAPVHSLVAGVMAGVAEPVLLVPGSGTPHGYNLRPSDVRELSGAALVFRIGDSLERFLSKPLAEARVPAVALLEAPGVTLLALREGGVWGDHGHGEPADAEAAPDHDHEDHDDIDPHIWLDPRNAIAMVDAIAAALTDIDPQHGPRYRANATRLKQRLERFDADLAARLAPVAERPYVVFHDAYQYFEHRYGLAAVGSITVDPELRPGARRVQEIRHQIQNRGALCVFSEPQFRPALVAVLIADTPAGTAVLDPLGSGLASGPELYFELLHRLAGALTGCLGR